MEVSSAVNALITTEIWGTVGVSRRHMAIGAGKNFRGHLIPAIILYLRKMVLRLPKTRQQVSPWPETGSSVF